MAEGPSDSILTSTKKVLGIEDDYTVFDIDIIMHINSAFSTLLQVADIGSPGGFEIADKEATWSEVIQDKKYLNSLKTYIVQKVRLAFDPPSTSFAIDAIDKQIKEAEWRLSLYAPPAVYSSTPEEG